MSEETATRRTAQIRVRGRAADVVARVTSATAHELSRVGYAALRVEDVAERSGVNKTTIYRRWPTKAALVAAVIAQHSGQLPNLDTGTLRGDLRASLFVGVRLSPAQQGILRVVQTERAEPEIDAITRQFRAEIRRLRLAMVERGIARGELPAGVDAELLVDLVSAPVQQALLFSEQLDSSYIDRVLDTVLAGIVAAMPTARSRRKRGATAQKPRRTRA